MLIGLIWLSTKSSDSLITVVKLWFSEEAEVFLARWTYMIFIKNFPPSGFLSDF
jgi:hypothetical protein